MAINNKKAAIELSIGTIVIIVLAMSMLILGLVLIKNIFTGAIGTSELVDKNVKAQLNQLFNEEDRKSGVYLPDNQAEIKKGKSYIVRYAVKNTIRGESAPSTFVVSITAGEIESGCRLTASQAEKYIKIGSRATIKDLLPGEQTERTLTIQPTEDAPLCYITYDIRITRNGEAYTTDYFTVKITA